MPKRTRGLGVYVAILATLVLLAGMLLHLQAEPPTQEKYSDIISYFHQDRVGDFVVNFNNDELKITVMDNQKLAEPIVYTLPNLSLFLNDVEDYLIEYNKQNPDNTVRFDYIRAKDMSWVGIFLPTFLLIGVMIIFWVVMMRQTRGGGGNVSGFGKAKARSGNDGRKVTFADVAGADEEKEELVEIVDFLKTPSKFNTLGARIPKGVLLVGPPGTGKTLLARAVAGEAEVQFFSISGSDFVEMFVGVGASRVRDLFEQAKKNAPSVIFIDEIDAVGRQRGAGLGGGHDEREQTLNQLLVEMDGFAANAGVIVMAATNRRDILDPALLRPGRFDRQIYVNYPDIKGREEILKVHTKNKPLAPDVLLLTIAKTTAGFTGADLENLVNEAALLAARRNLHAITMTEIEEALLKVAMGPEKKSHVVTEKDKKLTCYHEAGHALCFYYCDTQDPVHQVSIIQRGPAGGFTMPLPTEDRSYLTKKYMYEQIVVAMGGRVAEELVLGDISTGASGDIRSATATARNMVMRYGFSESVGPILYGQSQSEVFLGRDYSAGPSYSEEIAAEIDREVRSIIENAYKQTTEILSSNINQLHLLSQYLYENEKIDGEDFMKLMRGEMNLPYVGFIGNQKIEQSEETEVVSAEDIAGNNETEN